MGEVIQSVLAVCSSCGATNRVPQRRLGDDPICGRCKARVFPRGPVQASDVSFRREVEESPLPVLVDFWAPWCAPCRTMGPILDELARERAGHLKVVKVNVDESPDAARRFGIQAVPTLMLWREGAPAPVAQGAVPKRELEKLLAPLLS